MISNKEKITLDKPIFIGSCVLDDSKAFMYDFYYNELKKDYNDKVQLLYMDTDSLIVELKTECLYKDELLRRPKYDLSNYPSPLTDNKNKAQLGFFKDEYAGIPMIEFCGLAPKIYSIQAQTDEIIRSKCKGSKEKYKHQQFKDSLMNSERVRSNFNILRGMDHKI